MNLREIPKVGTTDLRKAFWDQVRAEVLASQKLPGANVLIDEYRGQGTVINAIRQSTGGGECPCPRDVTEVNVIQLASNNMCDPGCNLTAFHSWVRIPFADSYTTPKQFKLWLDASCNVNFEINPAGDPISDHCDGLNTCGTITITTISFSNTALTLAFDVVSTCAGCGTNPCTATFPETEIPFASVCNLSAILDGYHAFQDCGGGTSLGGSVLIF